MSKIIRRTIGTKKEIGAALVLAQTGNSVEFFWPAPNLFRELRPGVSVVGTEKWKCHANETGANFPRAPQSDGRKQQRDLARTAQFFARFAESAVASALLIRAITRTTLPAQPPVISQ